jgi:hypothetical protein
VLELARSLCNNAVIISDKNRYLSAFLCLICEVNIKQAVNSELELLRCSMVERSVRSAFERES